jgi:hypothetical protein
MDDKGRSWERKHMLLPAMTCVSLSCIVSLACSAAMSARTQACGHSSNICAPSALQLAATPLQTPFEEQIQQGVSNQPGPRERCSDAKG